MILDDERLEERKTKNLKLALDKLGLGSVLIITGPEVDENFRLASRNLPFVDVLPAQGLNVYDILRRDTLVLTRDAIRKIEERFHGPNEGESDESDDDGSDDHDDGDVAAPVTHSAPVAGDDDVAAPMMVAPSSAGSDDVAAPATAAAPAEDAAAVAGAPAPASSASSILPTAGVAAAVVVGVAAAAVAAVTASKSDDEERQS